MFRWPTVVKQVCQVLSYVKVQDITVYFDWFTETRKHSLDNLLPHFDEAICALHHRNKSLNRNAV